LSTLSIPTARAFVPLLEPARDKVARGGRGSGKSHFFAGLLIEDCVAEPGNSAGEGMRGVCIREVQKDLAQSSKLLIESKLTGLRLGEADGFKVFKDCIKTPGDGILIFKGMNDYTADSIKSLEGFKRAWWEEAHGATKNSINLLRPTMRASGSQMWWSYNRRLKNDPIDVMFSGNRMPTGAIVVNANWRENPWLTAELEQERLDCLNNQPEAYPHIWEGDYVTALDGAYFAKELAQAKLKGRICRLSADPLMAIRSYHDIGGKGAKADAYSIWICQFVGKEIRVLDHYTSQGQPLSFHVAWMREQGYQKAEVILPHDGVKENDVTGKRYEQHWRDADFSVRVIPNQGEGAAMMRVEAARRLFSRIWFDVDLTDVGRSALGWYHEQKHALGHGMGPKHDWSSHDADAFGMMCMDYQEPTSSAELNVSMPNLGLV
jgi:phage terminase large subunit